MLGPAPMRMASPLGATLSCVSETLLYKLDRDPCNGCEKEIRFEIYEVTVAGSVYQLLVDRWSSNCIIDAELQFGDR